MKPRYVTEVGPDDAAARFSPDRRHRYQLHRWLTSASRQFHGGAPSLDGRSSFWRSVVFVMLNPSTADAFKLDPTITKCARMAKGWGFDRIDVVNLYSFRTPYPRALAEHVKEGLIRFPNGADVLEWSGCGLVNDAHILGACAGADLAIAAWGNDGHCGGITYDGKTRGAHVREWLEAEGIELHNLGTTEGGSPLHPLARGRHWIPYDREPVRWA